MYERMGVNHQLQQQWVHELLELAKELLHSLVQQKAGDLSNRAFRTVPALLYL